MAKEYKVLGKLQPSAPNTWERVYAVQPTSDRALISTAVVVNQDSADQTFQVAVLNDAGPPADPEDCVAFDEPGAYVKFDAGQFLDD